MKSKLLIFTTCFLLLLTNYTFAMSYRMPNSTEVSSSNFQIVYTSNGQVKLLTSPYELVKYSTNLRFQNTSYNRPLSQYLYNSTTDKWVFVEQQNVMNTTSFTDFDSSNIIASNYDIYNFDGSVFFFKPIPKPPLVTTEVMMGAIPLQIFPIVVGLIIGLVAFRKGYQMLYQVLRGA